MFNQFGIEPFASIFQYIPGFVLAIMAGSEFILKGFALWEAAKNRDKVWFILIFILNTIGLLPLVYLFYFSKKNSKKIHKSKE